jgi:hypothetical protein
MLTIECLLIFAMHIEAAIFADYVEKIIEVFIDGFYVYGTSLNHCLHNFDKV